MSGIGILAYGSLIDEPGEELGPLIARRIPVKTPFPVEFVRISSRRGGAPTVAPACSGRPVKALLLVLEELVSLDQAVDMLWRREARKAATEEHYDRKAGPNAVVVKDHPRLCGLEHALYTDFNPSGKVVLDARQLAERAIGSVSRAPSGLDGISYVMALVKAGVETELTAGYVAAILDMTRSRSREEALETARRMPK